MSDSPFFGARDRVALAKVTAAPSAPADGATVPLSLDAAGNLRVTPGATGPGALQQGSTTADQAGTLSMGAATTASPTLTTLKTSPLSLTTKGGLRSALIDSSGAELDYTSPVPTYNSLIAVNDLTSLVVKITTATTTPVIAAVPGQTTRVHRMRMNVSGACTVTILDGATILEEIAFPAAAIMSPYDFSSRPWFVTSVNSALNITTSAAVTVNAVLSYVRSV